MTIWSRVFAGCGLACLCLLVCFAVICMFCLSNSIALSLGLLANAYSSSGAVNVQLASKQYILLIRIIQCQRSDLRAIHSGMFLETASVDFCQALWQRSFYQLGCHWLSNNRSLDHAFKALTTWVACCMLNKQVSPYGSTQHVMMSV